MLPYYTIQRQLIFMVGVRDSNLQWSKSPVSKTGRLPSTDLHPDILKPYYKIWWVFSHPRRTTYGRCHHLSNFLIIPNHFQFVNYKIFGVLWEDRTLENSGVTVRRVNHFTNSTIKLKNPDFHQGLFYKSWIFVLITNILHTPLGLRRYDTVLHLQL